MSCTCFRLFVFVCLRVLTARPFSRPTCLRYVIEGLSYDLPCSTNKTISVSRVLLVRISVDRESGTSAVRG